MLSSTKVYLDAWSLLSGDIAIYGSRISRDWIKARNHNNGQERKKNLDSSSGFTVAVKKQFEKDWFFVFHYSGMYFASF